MPNLQMKLYSFSSYGSGTDRCCGVLFIGSTRLGSKPIVPVREVLEAETPVVSLLLVGFSVDLLWKKWFLK
jgi:hypothetical protein